MLIALKVDKCIDKESCKWVTLDENVLKNLLIMQFHLDSSPSNHKCEKCQELQVIDPETKQCIKYYKWYGN